MNDLADLIAARIAPNALAALRATASAAESAGAAPHLVGGSVRDILMSRSAITDLDVSLLGADAAIFERIASLTGGELSKRSRFGTAKLEICGMSVDLAVSRSESYPAPGSLPVVRRGDLRQDLARRDFSVNAMAISLAAATWGDLIDPLGGLADVERRRLRILHEHSFRDDPTRILRAARYAARLGLELCADTQSILLESLGFMDRLSPARVRNELERVFGEDGAASHALRLLSDWGGIRAIHPALRYDARAWDRFSAETRGMTSQDRACVAYAILSFGASDSDAVGIVARLNPSSSASRAIRDSARLARLQPNLAALTNSQLASALDPLSLTALRAATLAASPTSRHRISDYLALRRHVRPHLSGDDLIAMGARHGPQVGRILKRLRYSLLDGEVSTRAEERALAEELLRQG